MNNKDDVSQKSPPGLVGLQNLGNTCYMNGALQALSNCQQLTRFLLNCPTYLKDKGLCHSYSELIKQIWDQPDSHYAAPTSIIRIIKCIYPDFRGCTQQDTQEFLRCFLEQLHTELKQEIPSTSGDLTSNQQIKSDLDDDDISTYHQALSDEKLDKGEDDDETEDEEPGPVQFKTHHTNHINHLDDRPNFNMTNHIAADDHEDSLSTNSSNISSDNISSSKSNKNVKIKRDINTSKKEEKIFRSIISDIFEFKISSSVVCSSCNNTSTTIECFKDLSIPIPSRDHPYYSNGYLNNNDHQPASSSPSSSSYSSKTSKLSSSTNKINRKSSTTSTISRGNDDDDTSRSSGSQELLQSYSYPIILAKWFWDWLGYFRHWFWTPSVALDDCLSIFFGRDPLEGDNEYSCDVCNKKNKGVKYLKILELPEVLCIHFKRYESIGSSKITTHVSFPIENLDLASYMCENARPQSTKYRLISCICHHGSALLTGHYTTYALNCYDDQWYEFDDEYVTNVDQKQVEDSEAYILFYQKIMPSLQMPNSVSSTTTTTGGDNSTPTC